MIDTERVEAAVFELEEAVEFLKPHRLEYRHVVAVRDANMRLAKMIQAAIEDDPGLMSILIASGHGPE